MADTLQPGETPGGAPHRDAADPPLPPQPAGAAAPAVEAAEEASVGSTEAARAVNAALLALSRTARSFTLYDAQNDSVRGFLADLRARFQAALEKTGELRLEVRPFELAWHGDVVYLERERERSLAFRLFRDGVRQLTFDPDLDWDDILGLVEILSLRYTGVRQQEDDVVTMLHKAGFRHVHFVAVEGFVPDQEITEEEDLAAEADRLPPPGAFDLPLPAHGAPVRVARREVPEHVLAALRAEETAATLPDDAVSLLRELLALVSDAKAGIDVDEVAPTLIEIRDYLVAEGDFAQLCRLTDGLARSAAGDMRPVPSLLAQLADAESLARLAQWARRQAAEPPPEFFAFVERLPGNPIVYFLDQLQEESDNAARAGLLAVIAGLVRRRPEPVLRRLAEADTRTSRELLAIVARTLPGRAVDAALLLKDVPDPVLQVEVLHVLQGAPYDSNVGRAVLKMLASKSADVIQAAADYLATHGEQRAFDTVVRRLQDGGAQLETDVACALGQTLARLAPQPAFALFDEWLHQRSLLGRVVETAGRRALQYAATAGLAKLPGTEAEQTLRAFFEKSAGDMRRHCLTLLVERRRAAITAAATANAQEDEPHG